MKIPSEHEPCVSQAWLLHIVDYGAIMKCEDMCNLPTKHPYLSHTPTGYKKVQNEIKKIKDFEKSM